MLGGVEGIMNWKKLGITNTAYFFFGFVRSIIGLCYLSPSDKEFKLKHGLELTTKHWFGNNFPDDVTQELSIFFIEDLELSRKIFLDSFKQPLFTLVLRDENKGYLLGQCFKEKYIEQYQNIFSVFEDDCKMFPARFIWRLRMKKAIKKSERFFESLSKEQKVEIKKFLLSFIDVKPEFEDDFLRRFWGGCELGKFYDHEAILNYIGSYYKVWNDGCLESEAEQLFKWKRKWDDGQGLFDF